MIERPKVLPISKKLPWSTTRLDDRAHLVDLAAVARDRRQQALVAPSGSSSHRIVGGSVVDRGRQIGQEAARAGERFFLGVGRLVDGAGARLDLPAAQLLLVELLAEPRHHRRAGDEHRRDSFVITE